MASGQLQRVFFGLWPSVEVAETLRKRADGLAISGRPVATDRLHLTLAFHGHCDAAEIERLASRAGQTRCPAFDLVFDRVGFFPRSGVVWIGPGSPPSTVFELARSLSGDRIDYSAFKPHITAYRRASQPETRSITPVRARFEQFCLVASGQAGRPGPYRKLASWPLKVEGD